MLLDPGVGFVIVHELACLAPGAKGAGRKIEIARPDEASKISIDPDPREEFRFSERLENRPAANQRRKIDLRGESILEGDAQTVAAERLCGRYSLFVILVHDDCLVEGFDGLRLATRHDGYPCGFQFLLMQRSPFQDHAESATANPAGKHDNWTDANGNGAPFIDGVEMRHPVFKGLHPNFDSIETGKSWH